MGGKGKRRREKNYKAAHGGYNRLPLPPDPSSLDALPAKLRKIIAFVSSSTTPSNTDQSSEKSSVNAKQKVKRGNDNSEKKPHQEVEFDAKISGVNHGRENERTSTPRAKDNGHKCVQMSTVEKKKKKRKKQRVDDLRFESEVEKIGVISTRWQRKKEYLKSKKKKKKKKANSNENQDVAKHDEVKFGEVVKAPPKLAVIPKASKRRLDASHERLRIKAIEDYRNRKHWTSRPGIHLPSAMPSSSLFWFLKTISSSNKALRPWLDVGTMHEQCARCWCHAGCL
ncbi:hypothetical protein Nepgr_024345 [Nepenthes gracilis]|uniref:Uncharacterized protein n=1 Tax=Nepenthes gracilis TaxID=150966 RepID=A0AAD3T5T8_NEPGR|nr:hypothetical protein Nepgr_024345 [Nepenthes gracilis]